MDPNEAILEAVKKGDELQVKTLLSADPHLANARTAGGGSAVLLAIYYGHPELVDILLEAGLELDIFEACAAGKLARLDQILIRQPRLVNAYAPDGFTPLGLAAFFGYEDLVITLLDRGAQVNLRSRNALGVQPLHSSVANQRLAISERLLDAGAEVNSPQQDGITPLHEAADNGQAEMVRLLLRYGADRQARAIDGSTPLDMAKRKDRQEVVRILEKLT